MQMWEPPDQESSFLWMATEEAASSDPFDKEATAQNFIPSVQHHFIAASSELFSSYISAETRQNQDSYTADYDACVRTMKLLGTNTVKSAGANDHGQYNDAAL